MMTHPWRLLLALAAVAVLAAACAEDPDIADPTDDDVDEPDEPDDDPDDPDDEPDEPEDEGAHEGEEITVWIMQPGSDTLEEMLEGYTEEFEEEHGADVTLTFQPWDDAHDAFTTALAGDDVPDVAEMGTTWTPEFGVLGAFAEQDLGDEDYIDAVVDTGAPEGEPLGVPWYAAARALIYNVEVFEDLGLEPPETWDELVEVGETIQAETDMYAYGVVGAGANHFVLPRVWQAGGEIAEPDNDSWTATINEPEGVEAFEHYTDLFTEHEFAPEGALGWTVADAQEAFTQEDLAMFQGLGANVDAVEAGNEDLEVGVALLPEGPGGNRDTFAGGSHLVRFADSEAPEAAQAYIDFLMTDERVAEFSEEIGFFPGTEEGIDALDLDERGEVFAEMLTEHSRSYPPTAEWGAFEGDDLFVNAVQEIMQGDAEVSEALDEIAEEMDAAFQE